MQALFKASRHILVKYSVLLILLFNALILTLNRLHFLLSRRLENGSLVVAKGTLKYTCAIHHIVNGLALVLVGLLCTIRVYLLIPVNWARLLLVLRMQRLRPLALHGTGHRTEEVVVRRVYLAEVVALDTVLRECFLHFEQPVDGHVEAFSDLSQLPFDLQIGHDLLGAARRPRSTCMAVLAVGIANAHCL